MFGYDWLLAHYKLQALPLRLQVKVGGRVISSDAERLTIPGALADTLVTVTDHLLFALKHEDVRLDILVMLFEQPDFCAQCIQMVQAAPNSQYSRKLGFLYESWTGNSLDISVAGPVIPFFDPENYITGSAKTDAKWRIAFNGLGTLQYCPIVRKTPTITQLAQRNILETATAYVGGLKPAIQTKALAWAYLSETTASFAIEREAVTDKNQAFMQELLKLKTRTPLSEYYLVSLQNGLICNPRNQEFQFRTQQNWLRNGAKGPMGVTYIPPSVEHLESIIPDFFSAVNALPTQCDPLMAGILTSFGFVYLHPFLDGNGRTSRLLIHNAMGESNSQPWILPVSVAMHRHEDDYLAALESFSTPARQLWSVKGWDMDSFTFEFNSHPAMYRYWDATTQVEFGYAMAAETLDIDLKKEVEFLLQYDELYRRVNALLDIRPEYMHKVIRACIQNNGTISNNWRKKLALCMPADYFTKIEGIYKDLQNDEHGEESEPDSPMP